ncbi:MAG: hypothetical protein DRQ37_01410 [Gammaproteobacteria bacterium]|nr:MAG: hypothetical protein DRQ37_01410 [Gammaproteobacteria bacterium]
MTPTNRRSDKSTLTDLLAGSAGGLRELLAHAKTIQLLDQALSAFLAEPLRTHCCVANAQGDLLTLQVDSPVWKTRLHYLTPQIQEHLRRSCQLNALTRTRIIVQPKPRPDTIPSHQPHISAVAARTLEDVAEGTDNDDLAAILRRLAGRRT